MRLARTQHEPATILAGDLTRDRELEVPVTEPVVELRGSHEARLVTAISAMSTHLGLRPPDYQQ